MNTFTQTSVKIVLTVLIPMTFIGCDKFGSSSSKNDTKTTPVASTTTAKPETIGALPKNVLVRIKDWSLTQAEFDERLALLKQGIPDFKEDDAATKQMVLDELIRQQLLVLDAQSSDIGQSKDIKDAVEDFRKTLLVQELANRLTKDIAVTEAEAQTYYNENKALFADPIKWKVREIVVADEATAKNILVAVLQGGDFAQTAQAQSKGKTAAAGGLLEDFTTPPFEAMGVALANLDVGGTSSVFKGPNGFYIVHVDGKTGGTPKAFVEVKKELIAGLTLRKQQQVVLEHLNKLATDYKVEINKDLVGETMK